MSVILYDLPLDSLYTALHLRGVICLYADGLYHTDTVHISQTGVCSDCLRLYSLAAPAVAHLVVDYGANKLKGIHSDYLTRSDVTHGKEFL